MNNRNREIARRSRVGRVELGKMTHTVRDHRMMPASETDSLRAQMDCASSREEFSMQSRGSYPERQRLVIMKFGGTSVGDACCISRVVDIVRKAREESQVVVVVSAIAGATNRLLEAAHAAEAEDAQKYESIIANLSSQHEELVNHLLASPEQRAKILDHIRGLLEEGRRLCQGTLLLGELTPRVRDAISGLGERLSAPLLAASLNQAGVPSEAIEATEVVVTDGCHGNAEPWMDLTREQCESRVLPLLQQGILPVVTGFIGASPEGVLTTLGRGGSDYSATILGAALKADEVEIWSDVDGLMTADPRLVPGACTISEISYREAAELAYFGAKVLHPKTLRAVMQRGIPLWIRNTFSPERPGTRITPSGPAGKGAGVKSLTATSDVALITVGGPVTMGVPDVLGRTFATISSVRAEVLLISHASSQNEICLAVPTAVAERTVEALRHEFAQDLNHERVEHIAVDSGVAIVTVVGQNMRGEAGIASRTFAALGRENVSVIAVAQGSSDCNISFVIAQEDVRNALVSTHREFDLEAVNSQPVNSMAV